MPVAVARRVFIDSLCEVLDPGAEESIETESQYQLEIQINFERLLKRPPFENAIFMQRTFIAHDLDDE